MQNHGITIYLDNFYNVDLHQILNCVGEVGKNSAWRISNAECLGKTADKIHKISDNQKEISGEEFYQLISNIHQTLSGEFDAFRNHEDFCWLKIRSIRGDCFDIETEDKELLNRIHKSFHNITDLIY